MAESPMTRDQMLEEMDTLRGNGHIVNNYGSAGDWTCELDGVQYKGKTPMEAFTNAKNSLNGGE